MGQYANTADRTWEEQFGATVLPELKKLFPGFRIAETTDGYVASAPVGKFLPNAFGLHDMIGNVAEWCSDWYGGRYYAESPPRNPTGPLDGQFGVLRGGSWCHGPWYCRSANRLRNAPDDRGICVGFRVLRTQE
jgi:formylglycine-generating enzyme required for sulfatase activity